jgi:hypothetical protein
MEFAVVVYGCPLKTRTLDDLGIHHRASCLKFVRPEGLLKALIVIDEVAQELDKSIESVGTACSDLASGLASLIKTTHPK